MVYYNALYNWVGNVIPYITQPTKVFFIAHLLSWRESWFNGSIKTHVIRLMTIPSIGKQWDLHKTLADMTVHQKFVPSLVAKWRVHRWRFLFWITSSIYLRLSLDLYIYELITSKETYVLSIIILNTEHIMPVTLLFFFFFLLLLLSLSPPSPAISMPKIDSSGLPTTAAHVPPDGGWFEARPMKQNI